ncbi:unnamed protein product [Aphanomyces euteiches]
MLPFAASADSLTPPEFPNASNTGVNPAATLTVLYGQVNPANTGGYAPYVIDQDNTVLENVKIIGGLIINAHNVTIRNCSVISSFGTGESVNGTGVINIFPGATATIENCTLDGSNRTHAGIWYEGANLEAKGNNIFNINDGIFLWDADHFDIEDNYLHDFTDETSNGHIDGIQTEGALHGIIRHNTIDITQGQNACIAIWNDRRSSGDIWIDNNLMAGGNYTIYAHDLTSSGEAAPGATITNIRITDNVFSTVHSALVGRYGVWYPTGPTDGWNNAPDSGKSYRSGNYVLETGQNIDQNQPGDISLPPAGAGEWYSTGDADIPGGEHILGTENTGIVTTEFEITPKKANADSAVGYTDSSTTATGWSSLSAIFQLNVNGYFDARNGGVYPLENLASDATDLPPTALRGYYGSQFGINCG